MPTISDADIAAVSAVLKSRHLEDGETVRAFERETARYIGRNYALATSSGFAAIHLALIGLGVGEGDEVILPAYCCPAILNPVLLQHAVPVVVDIERDGFNISVEEVGRAISPKTRAIIVPHMFGVPARIDEICSLRIPVIEDCAQAIGCSFRGRKLGSFSDISVFSFYATKMICAGDGGMAVTDDPKIYRRMEDYRYYGHRRGLRHTTFNYHLTNLPASLGLSQLKRVDEFVAARREISRIYDRYFADVDSIDNCYQNKDYSVFYRYPIMIQQRDSVKDELARRGILCGFGVLEGLHRQVAATANSYEQTEDRLSTVLSLPIYPNLQLKQAGFIAEEVCRIIRSL